MIQGAEKIPRIFLGAKKTLENTIRRIIRIKTKYRVKSHRPRIRRDISVYQTERVLLKYFAYIRFQFIRGEEREYSRGRAGPARRGEAKRNGRRRVARAGSAAKRKGEARAQRTMNSRGSRQLPSPGNVPTRASPSGRSVDTSPSAPHAHVHTHTRRRRVIVQRMHAPPSLVHVYVRSCRVLRPRWLSLSLSLPSPSSL